MRPMESDLYLERADLMFKQVKYDQRALFGFRSGLKRLIWDLSGKI